MKTLTRVIAIILLSCGWIQDIEAKKPQSAVDLLDLLNCVWENDTESYRFTLDAERGFECIANVEGLFAPVTLEFTCNFVQEDPSIIIMQEKDLGGNLVFRIKDITSDSLTREYENSKETTTYKKRNIK